jgi:hypothetical protein
MAVTVAVWDVVSWTRATPLASDCAVVEFSVPVDVVNSTETPGKGLFEASITRAEMVTVPPLCETLEGEALSAMPPTAAAPTRTSAPPELLLPLPVRAPPENA